MSKLYFPTKRLVACLVASGLALLVACRAQPPAWAAAAPGDTPGTTAPATEGGGDKPALTETKPSNANALRLSVVNAVINYVNNAREARINLEWDLLPVSDDLLLMAEGIPGLQHLPPLQLTLANDDLGNPKAWANHIKDPRSREALKAALGGIDLETYTKQNSDAAFNGFWSHLVKSPRPDAIATNAELITSFLDHHLLSVLLESHGVRYVVAVPDAKIRGENPRIFTRQIRWRITLYPIRLSDKTLIYRVGIRSELAEPYLLHFPGTTETKATLKAQVSLRPSQVTIGVPEKVLTDTKDVNLVKVQKEDLQDVSSRLGGSKIEGVLKFVGGADLGEVVSQGFLGGTSRASVYYGGLVGRGEVQQVVGVNQLVAPSPSGEGGVGVLLGVVPQGDNALFLGPSFQAGPFTLALGGLASEKAKKAGSSDKKIVLQSALSLSFNVSEALGSKKSIQTVRLENSVIGGQSSDVIARQLYVAQIRFVPGPALTPEQRAEMSQSSVVLRQAATFGPDGKDVPVTDTGQVIEVPVSEETKTFFVPQGKYVFDLSSLKAAGYELHAAGDAAPVGPPVNESVRFPIGKGRSGFFGTYVVVRKP